MRQRKVFFFGRLDDDGEQKRKQSGKILQNKLCFKRNGFLVQGN